MAPTIRIVTPCMNMRSSVDRTILSVVTQAGDFCVRYHVKDGGSTDGTAERLEWWARELAGGRLPLQCEDIAFTWSSEPDGGMYDAIIQGFSHMAPDQHDWLTWINADDILMPGAFAFVTNVDRQFQPDQVSWLGGAACVARDGHPMTSFDRALPTQVIRAGLCDGIHWDFLQQEGTFFRKWLWDSADPARTLRPMRLAGDWNLWRLLAQRANLVQWAIPLGCFTIIPGQLSTRQRDRYEQEMDALVGRPERAAALQALGDAGRVVRRRFKSRYPDGQLTIVEEALSDPLAERCRRVFGAGMKLPQHRPAETIVKVGNPTPKEADLPPLAEVVRQSGGVLAYDHGWQFPAVTEQHAYQRVRDTITLPEGITYVAYPWATLIDKLQSNAKDARLHLQRFRRFVELLPPDTVKVTVCQQIYMRKFMDLFAQAGIDHVFWSHATPRDAEDAVLGAERPAVHPFPLYPVQIAEALPAAAIDADGERRPFLFSFIGARANHHYPRKTRDFILDMLEKDQRGLVTGRAAWFYEKIVYHHQILRTATAVPEALVEQDQAAQFRVALEQSTFSLCPAGTGPNSIRLWESIGAGAIPVILADDWAPPGNRALWEAACLFRTETAVSVSALPDELEALAEDHALLAAKRQAMRQLWLLYGTGGFVHDIHKLAQALKPGKSRVREVQAPPEHVDEARSVLTRLADLSLLDRPGSAKRKTPDHPLPQQAASAPGVLEPGHSVRRQFEAAAASGAMFALRRQSPAVLRGAVPKVHYFGRHSHRTPLSYEPFLREIRGSIAFVDRPEDADLLLSGFNVDFVDAAERLAELRKANPRLKLMVLSEEPLWDVYWSGGFTETERMLANGIHYRFLNHENSAIFDFERCPYFVLTDDEFAATYAIRIEAMTRLTPAALLARWNAAPVPAAFFAEHRTANVAEPSFPDGDILRMIAHRSAIAEAVRDKLPGTLCIGKGWRDQVRRQELASWHLDKLATLAGRTRMCSAIENTHHYRYVSEKLFDSFAVGAIPIYCASPRHRSLEFVPDEAMINIAGLDAAEAAQRILDFRHDGVVAEAWLDTARRLAALFANVEALRAERQRIARAALMAVSDLIETATSEQREQGGVESREIRTFDSRLETDIGTLVDRPAEVIKLTPTLSKREARGFVVTRPAIPPLIRTNDREWNRSASTDPAEGPPGAASASPRRGWKSLQAVTTAILLDLEGVRKAVAAGLDIASLAAAATPAERERFTRALRLRGLDGVAALGVAEITSHMNLETVAGNL